MSDPLFPVKAFVDPAELAADVSINRDDLDSGLLSQAGLYVHYARLSADAREQLDRVKIQVEVFESRLFATHRKALLDAGEKATEAAVNAAVKGDTRWYRAQQSLITAKAAYDFANDAREAFKQRESALIQLASSQRKEREGQVRIGVGQDITNALREDALRIIRQQQEQPA